MHLQLYSQGEPDCLLELIQCAHLCLISNHMGAPSISSKHCQSIQTSSRLPRSSGMAPSLPALQPSDWLLPPSPSLPAALWPLFRSHYGHTSSRSQPKWTLHSNINSTPGKYNHSPSFHVSHFDKSDLSDGKRWHNLWCYQFYCLMTIFSATGRSNINKSYLLI